ARSELDTQLAQAEATIERLNADQAGLSDQLAAATDDATAAQAARDRLEQQIASLDADARQAAEARVTERDELTRQVTALETRLDAATSQRDEVDAQLAQAREAIAALDADKSDLSDQLANLETQLTTVTTARDTAASQAAELETEMAGLRSDLAEAVLTQETTQARLAAAVERGQQRVVALEDDLDVAEQQIAELDQTVAGLNRTNNLLLTETERLRKEGSWIAQVVGYHRGYAGSMREVEISAEQQEEKQMLTKWLGSTFGRSFTVPELDGLTFIGGRVFFVSGIPTGQIAYHDAEGRLTGFCFTPSQDVQTSELIEGRDDDLNLVYWRKGAFHYVLVGWAASDQLKPLAAELQQTYGEET
ncbi:MAG: hypothetical protein OET79_07355, partial [Nitrospirota bacterium]|nr:hypothetical protein [Nitrospirota bacterium]